MTDAATEPQAQTALNPDDVSGTVNVAQPNAQATTEPVPEEPLAPAAVHHFSFWEFLKHFFEPGGAQQHYSLVAHHDSDGTLRASVQPAGKPGPATTFSVAEDGNVTNVAAK